MKRTPRKLYCHLAALVFLAALPPRVADAAACRTIGPYARDVAAYVAAAYQIHAPGDDDLNIILAPRLSAAKGVTPQEQDWFFSALWGPFMPDKQWLENIHTALKDDERQVRRRSASCRSCLGGVYRAGLCYRTRFGDFFSGFTTSRACKALFACEPCLFEIAGRDAFWHLYDDVAPTFQQGTLSYYAPTGEVSVPIDTTTSHPRRGLNKVQRAAFIANCQVTLGLKEAIRGDLLYCERLSRFKSVREVVYETLNVSESSSGDCHVTLRPGGMCGKKVLISGPTVLEGKHFGQPEIHPIHSIIVQDNETRRPKSVSRRYSFAGFIDARTNTCYPEWLGNGGKAASRYPATARFNFKKLHQSMRSLLPTTPGRGGGRATALLPYCRYSVRLRHNVLGVYGGEQMNARRICPTLQVTMDKRGQADWRGAAVAGRLSMGYSLVGVRFRLEATLQNRYSGALDRKPPDAGGPSSGPLRRWYRWKVKTHLTDDKGSGLRPGMARGLTLTATQRDGTPARLYRANRRVSYPSIRTEPNSEIVLWTPVRYEEGAGDPVRSYTLRLKASLNTRLMGSPTVVDVGDSVDLQVPRPSANISFYDVKASYLARGPLYSAGVRPEAGGFYEPARTLRWELRQVDQRGVEKILHCLAPPGRVLPGGQLRLPKIRLPFRRPASVRLRTGDAIYLKLEIQDAYGVERVRAERMLTAPALRTRIKGSGQRPGRSRSQLRLVAIPFEASTKGGIFKDSSQANGAPFRLRWGDMKWQWPGSRGWRVLPKKLWRVATTQHRGDTLLVDTRRSRSKGAVYQAAVLVRDRWGREAVGRTSSLELAEPAMKIIPGLRRGALTGARLRRRRTVARFQEPRFALKARRRLIPRRFLATVRRMSLAPVRVGRRPGRATARASCPRGRFWSSQDGRCVLQCPQCWLGHSQGTSRATGGQCLRECPPNHYAWPQDNLRRCWRGCPRGLLKVPSERSCASECPQGTYRSPRGRRDTCHGWCPRGWVKLDRDRTCVRRCPAGWLRGGTSPAPACVEQGCPAGQVAHANRCVSECPQGNYEHRGVCVRSCPSGLLHSFYRPNHIGGRCVSACPASSFKQGDMCVASCPRFGGWYTYQRECRQSCPGSWVKVPRDPTFSGGQCAQACPANMLKRRDACVWSCPSQTQVRNRECVSSSQQQPRCPAGQFEHQNRCLSTCPRPMLRYPQRQRCVHNCPPRSYRHQGSCLITCPRPWLRHQRSCVSQCPSGWRPWHGRCVRG